MFLQFLLYSNVNQSHTVPCAVQQEPIAHPFQMLVSIHQKILYFNFVFGRLIQNSRLMDFLFPQYFKDGIPLSFELFPVRNLTSSLCLFHSGCYVRRFWLLFKSILSSCHPIQIAHVSPSLLIVSYSFNDSLERFCSAVLICLVCLESLGPPTNPCQFPLQRRSLFPGQYIYIKIYVYIQYSVLYTIS